jgi:hypothetical protein
MLALTLAPVSFAFATSVDIERSPSSTIDLQVAWMSFSEARKRHELLLRRGHVRLDLAEGAVNLRAAFLVTFLGGSHFLEELVAIDFISSARVLTTFACASRALTDFE